MEREQKAEDIDWESVVNKLEVFLSTQPNISSIVGNHKEFKHIYLVTVRIPTHVVYIKRGADDLVRIDFIRVSKKNRRLSDIRVGKTLQEGSLTLGKLVKSIALFIVNDLHLQMETDASTPKRMDKYKAIAQDLGIDTNIVFGKVVGRE